MEDWFRIKGQDELITPTLLFYSERIDRNIAKMVEIAGRPDRLRPHIKTYKCEELVQRQLDAGIYKFKCATLAEAQMLLEMGVPDVLLAYPLAGASLSVFLALAAKADGRLSVLVDHPEQLRQWRSVTKAPVHCFIDLNVGMNRTGIHPEKAESLLPLLTENLVFCGWHVYDGHIHEGNAQDRAQTVETTFAPVLDLLNRVGPTYRGELICGGSITFPIHARQAERTLSPGTTLLWDYGYGSQFPDLDFAIAACLAMRVVSKPGDDLLCLNAGYKAVAAEMQAAPVYLPQLTDAVIVNHSEEHLVVRTSRASQFGVGALLYAFPWHICPTVALHESARLVENKQITRNIKIKARARLY